jgi:RNA polymerase sigma-70 factor (ECF subfamily)
MSLDGICRRSKFERPTAIGRAAHLTCSPDVHTPGSGGLVEARESPDRRTELQAIFADERRFRPWYDVAARRVYAYLFGRCGGDVTLAEELTQLTFMDALRHRDSYDGRADSITWLIAIARNRLLDHLRRQEREERRRIRLVVREIAPQDAHDAAWQTRDEREDILQAMRGLPATQRAALILHHVDGLPIKDVAAALGRSQTAVESLLSRGRERFRKVYEEQDRG